MTQKNTTRTPDGVEVYETEIEYALDCYLSEHPDIEDMHQEPQSRWNAALRYINKRVFRGTDKLKVKELYRQTGNRYINSNDNSYDIDKVYYILNKYIDLCFEYGKEVSIVGFSYLTGIEEDTFYSWANDNNSSYNATHKRSDIYKKLKITREESLSDRLYSSKGNPVGVLGILNHWYGWNMGQPHGSGDQHPRTIEQIQEQYTGESNRIPEKTPPELAENTPPAPENTPQAQEIPPTRENTPTPAEAPQRPQKPQNRQERQQAGETTETRKQSRRK